MQKRTLYYTTLICMLALAAGCKKFVESGNVNINPNRPSTVTLNTLLPAVEYYTSSNHFQVAYTTSLFSQQMASYQGGPLTDDQNRDVRMGVAYTGLYQNALTNGKLLIDQAKALGSPFYTAIGRILLVMNLSLATDTYGDVPFSEAFQAPVVLYPHYDKQEILYPLMQKYLDSAILESQQANPATLKPASDDLIYAGDMNAWRQTANFLKARLSMHLTKKGAVAAANAALASLSAGAYPDNSKDCQLVYNDKNLNPWYSNIAVKLTTGNYYIAPSKRFVDALNGTAYPGLVDPRLPFLMDKKTNAAYTGLQNGAGNTGNTTDLSSNTYFAKSNSPVLMATYAEQKLLEAEARFLANGGTATSVGSTQAAYSAYIAGIVANMQKLGVPAASIAADTSHPQVAVGSSKLTLELILREKQIALYLHPEAWVDVRRYDYNPALFRGMALPLGQDPAMGGQFIRRSGFPLDEVNRNPNVKDAIQALNAKVWWDQ
ncbi:MAG: SusD/RagB family nutrient-binding outer membrane lipoprotein [Williamsia sp.]|nr:SusD/RagB family nutrient-binding outer membrane lipoprotein [Williamsia sp.]